MLMTLNRMRQVGLSSTLSLAIVTLSPCSPAISSRIGAIILHGPHHSAQKSTRTGLVGAADGLVEGGGGEVHDAFGHGGDPFGCAVSVPVVNRVGRAGGIPDRAERHCRRPVPSPRECRSASVVALASSQRSASIAAMHPEPAAVIAWR